MVAKKMIITSSDFERSNFFSQLSKSFGRHLKWSKYFYLSHFQWLFKCCTAISFRISLDEKRPCDEYHFYSTQWVQEKMVLSTAKMITLILSLTFRPWKQHLFLSRVAKKLNASLLSLYFEWDSTLSENYNAIQLFIHVQ